MLGMLGLGQNFYRCYFFNPKMTRCISCIACPSPPTTMIAAVMCAKE